MNKAITNKLNAQHSTGPKTPKGTARSSKNAIKHGLTARDTVLASESKQEFEEHLQAVMASLDAVGEMEILLAQRVADCAWRLRRVMRIEAKLFDFGEDEALEDSLLQPAGIIFHSQTGIAASFNKVEMGKGTISNLTKYESSIERSMYRALHELQRLQANRMGTVSPVPMVLDVDVTGIADRDVKIS